MVFDIVIDRLGECDERLVMRIGAAAFRIQRQSDNGWFYFFQQIFDREHILFIIWIFREISSNKNEAEVTDMIDIDPKCAHTNSASNSLSQPFSQ